MRTGLTEDLDTRSQRGLLSAVTLGWRHRQQRRAARRRVSQIRAPHPAELPLYPEKLHIDSTALQPRAQEPPVDPKSQSPADQPKQTR
jgi:hypothetical protein